MWIYMDFDFNLDGKCHIYDADISSDIKLLVVMMQFMLSDRHNNRWCMNI